MESAVRKKPQRQVNWDLLRGLSMFFVVVVHTASYFPQFLSGFDVGHAIARTAIICDPVFFMLSGYFALRPLTGSLKQYYAKKISGVVLPLFLYSVILYVYASRHALSIGGYLSFAANLLSGNWWFVPTLIPYLILAPFVYACLERVSDEWIVRLTKLLLFIYSWGVLCHVMNFASVLIDRQGLDNLFSVLSSVLPRHLIGGYFPVFVLGYMYRRLSIIMDNDQKRSAAKFGVLAIVVCFLLSGLKVREDDPNQIWIIASLGLFFIFENVRISQPVVRRAIIWIGKRSFTVYLFQFTTIQMIFSFIWEKMCIDVGGTMPPTLSGIVLWIASTLASYAFALIVASIFDPLLLENIQKLIKSKVIKRL